MSRTSSKRTLLFDALPIMLACAVAFSATDPLAAQDDARDRIQPYADNPFYWQYRGRPVLLLGGTREDNLFQLTEMALREHLDELVTAGGNYIRNTMSDRDSGNVKCFHRAADGRYDLDRWNETYWQRLDTLLEETHSRGVIVQIELWAFHDMYDLYGGRWGESPWNPANNSNYSEAESGLATHYGPPSLEKRVHDFWHSVPALEDRQVLLRYQQRFVDRILSHTLAYDHVLYCVTNEIHPPYSAEWGRYWSAYVRSAAAAQGKRVEVSEMFWQTDLRHDQHRASLDHPEAFSYFEASQNSVQEGQTHYDRLAFVRERMRQRGQRRPITHVKTYGRSDDGYGWTGSDDEAVARFCRNILGGASSVRFHRDVAGLGLLPPARASIAAMRTATDAVAPWTTDPRPDLLSGRSSNEAYLLADPGTAYLLLFIDGGSVGLDLTAHPEAYDVAWVDIASGTWGGSRSTIAGGATPTIQAPGDGPWIAVIRRTAGSSDGGGDAAVGSDGGSVDGGQPMVDQPTNGSFERGLTGWSVDAGDGKSPSVAVRSDEGSSDGSRAAIFGAGDAPGNGSLSQLIAVDAGADYALHFDYGAFGARRTQSLEVSVHAGRDGETLASTVLTAEGPGDWVAANTTFAPRELAFSASSDSVIIRFTDRTDADDTRAVDGVLDRVRLVALEVDTGGVGRVDPAFDGARNGSFEDGLAAWSVASADAEPAGLGVRADEGTTDGGYAAVFGAGDRAGNAILSQRLDVTAGSGYLLRFDYGAFGAARTQTLRVEVQARDGSLLAATSQYATGPGNWLASATTFASRSLAFTATDDGVEIRFIDRTSAADGRAVDGVLDRVTVVPASDG